MALLDILIWLAQSIIAGLVTGFVFGVLYLTLLFGTINLLDYYNDKRNDGKSWQQTVFTTTQMGLERGTKDE